MRNKIVTIVFIVSLMAIAGTSYSGDKTLRGLHNEAQLECIDCHGVEEPVKRARASACKNCHEDHKGEVKTYYNNGQPVEVNPHDSHQGELRCTLCHKIHEPSVLYCNQSGCHSFDNNMNVK